MEAEITHILTNLLATAGLSYKEITVSTVADQKVYTIHTDDGRTLIGQHGDTVHALDTLVKKIVERKYPDESTHFLVDVNEYRVKQIKDLQSRALMMAERARSFQYDVELSPMSSYERLLVHATLSGEANIKTESAGEGRERRVVIRYIA